MASTPRTIFNQLSDLVMGSSENAPTSGTYTLGDEQQPHILKASSIEQRDELVAQTQQQSHFKTQLLNIMQGDTHKRVYYEGDRIQQYREYDAMEEYPDIARTLDLLAEEATMGSIKGKALNIYSDNERVRSVLTDFFYTTLDVGTNLFPWTRVMIKQGNCFLFHPMVAGRGITGARLLSTIDTERQELVIGDQPLVKFRYTPPTGKVEELTHYQVSHFRMFGNERHMPYGTSLLHRIRRTYKMLMMAKDAVLVYRLTRAPERRVHKIFTGNIEPNDIPEYLQSVANHHKKAQLVDQKTGDFNWQYQPATMDMDYYISVNSEGAGTQIDTLPGAQNLDALGDLNMLEDDLFGGLGVPKSFVKFNSQSGGSSGDGKSFSMLDIRLARLVNRIQQALLAELNRMAIVHLYLLGGDFRDEISNFTLTMNSPSVQLQLMHQELQSAELDNFIKAVTPVAEGMAAMSMAEGMKTFLHKSEAQVAQSMKDQFFESKIMAEIKAAPDLLPTSGLYDDLIRFAQAGKKEKTTAAGGADEQGGMGAPPMGGGGLPPMGGEGAGGPEGELPGGLPPEGAPMGGNPGSLNEQTLRAGRRLLELAQLLSSGADK